MHDITRLLAGPPWGGFREAVSAALQVLHSRVGLDVWLLTKVVGNDQVVLSAYPHGLIDEGTRLTYNDTFCRRMVAGEGPRVAAVVAAVPAYAGLRMGQDLKVSAYVGIPLTLPDGSLFGTLCGVASRAQGPNLARDLPLIELIAGLLSTVLAQQGERGTQS